MAKISRSRTAPAKNEDREARNRRTEGRQAVLVRLIRARPTSRSVTALTDSAASEWGTNRSKAGSETYVLPDTEC